MLIHQHCLSIFLLFSIQNLHHAVYAVDIATDLYHTYAQVLSESVSKALLDMGEEYSETAKFAEMMDKFFDCLNVNNFNAGKNKRKVFQDPYRLSDHDDFRIQVHTV